MESYIFNHDYVFRHDNKRTLIFGKHANNNSHTEWIATIHPIQAMILSFFSSPQILDIAIEKLSYFLDMKTDEVKELLNPFIENEEGFFTEYDNQKFLFPKNVLIKSSENKSPINEYTVDDFAFQDLDFLSKRMYSGPLNITFMPSNTCVTDCIYCYADKSVKVEEPLSIERLKGIVDEAKKMKILSFSLVGGEIFTFPKWFELLSHIKANGFLIDKPSTKVPLKEIDIEKLSSIGIKNIQISLDSLIPETLIHTLKVDISYIEKIKKSIEILSKYGFEISIATILTTTNCNMDDIYSIYNFIKNIDGITSWSLRPAFTSIYKDNSTNFIPSLDGIEKLFKEVKSSLAHNGRIQISYDTTFLERGYLSAEGGSTNFKGAECSANRSHLFILPDGNVTICEQLYWKPHFIIGNLKHQSIQEVWNSDRANWFANLDMENLSGDNPCKACGIFDDCYKNMNRCWAEVIKAYGDEHWDYPDPRCKLAPKMKTNLIYQ